MEERLLTTEEVANYFGVCEETVTNTLIKDGLKVVKLTPKNYRYRKEDVIEFVNMHLEMDNARQITNAITSKKIINIF